MNGLEKLVTYLKVLRGQNVNTPPHPTRPHPMNVVKEISITSTVLGPLAKICVTTRSVFGPPAQTTGLDCYLSIFLGLIELGFFRLGS